jgi:hypothetical protein
MSKPFSRPSHAGLFLGKVMMLGPNPSHAGVLADQVPKDAIPQATRLLKNWIGFLQAKPKLAKAF